MTCGCECSQYTYTPAGHVVTGNLKIIEDYRLRELIMKGPSYREQNNINWDLNMRLSRDAIVRFTRKWANELQVDGSVLRDWKNVVIECIRKRISLLKRKLLNKRKKQVLKNPKHINYLKNFHKHFVLVPADKAGSNVIVVCKKYYLDVILKELNSNLDTPNAYVATDSLGMDVDAYDTNLAEESTINTECVTSIFLLAT